MSWEWWKQNFWRELYTAPPEGVDLESFVVACYYVEPREPLTLYEAGLHIAAEESIGTWTTITTLKEYVYRLAAKVVKVEKRDSERGYVWVAYPLELFDIEAGIPNLLSIVAGNLFGLGFLRNVRLVDLELPREYVKAFKGPRFGLEGVRKLQGTLEERRPHLGTIFKPKVGLTPADVAVVAYEAVLGGVDFLKDDETLSSQSFNPVEERVPRVMEAIDRAREEMERGSEVLYAVSVTAHTPRLLEYADKALEHGANCLMVDVLTTGFSALQQLAEDASIKVPLHVHRAMHAAMSRNPLHGIHMKVIAKLVRLAGGDQLHAGTAAGKMERALQDVKEIYAFLRGEWHGLKPVMPVASGGVHPGLVPENIKHLGVDLVINAGGGIHGHPHGTRAGAKAMRQAIEAAMKGIPLEEYAKNHEELAKALKQWGSKRLSE